MLVCQAHAKYKIRGIAPLVQDELRDEARKIMTGKDGEALREKLLDDDTKREALLAAARETR